MPITKGNIQYTVDPKFNEIEITLYSYDGDGRATPIEITIEEGELVEMLAALRKAKRQNTVEEILEDGLLLQNHWNRDLL